MNGRIARRRFPLVISYFLKNCSASETTQTVCNVGYGRTNTATESAARLNPVENQTRNTIPGEQDCQGGVESLSSDSSVYKLVGPVLLKQDKEEAEDNVGKRLEFITSEIEKVEKNIKATQSTMQSKRLALQQQQQGL